MRYFDMFDLFDYVFDAPRISRRSYYRDVGALKEDGVTTYYENGRVHRLDGPAVVYDDKRESEYWLNGKRVTKEEHDKLRLDLEDKKQHTVYIDGVPKVISGKKLRLLNEVLNQ